MDGLTGGQVQQYEDQEGVRMQNEFRIFLETYKDQNDKATYLDEIAELLLPERNTLYVDLEHIAKHSETLSNGIIMHFYKLYPYLCNALQLVAIDRCPNDMDRQRMHKKELYVSFCNLQSHDKIRELTADKIGALICVTGQVVRTHAVHPELCRATFVCAICGVSTKNVMQQFRYTQPVKCSNAQCTNRTQFTLDVDDSSFVDFQKLRIQETQAELPRGAIPRTVDVIVRGEMVEGVQPGDRCNLTGTLIVIPDISQLSAPGLRAEPAKAGRGIEKDSQLGLSGLKALGVRELTYKLAFLASNIESNNTKFGGKDFTHETNDPLVIWKSMTDSEHNLLKTMSQDKNIQKNLTDSLFPNIFGNDEIKLGVLLMLFGGVGKRSESEGTTLRGDINVCLVGDPSTAKSQVLKTVEEFSPRAIYTSGKASTAAGLTAAVVKDEESYEFVIEAGALMLADNGVCCIDEFDKMDPKDQVAIHEAMEQQTISITKAGVKATLNARASILAAANPVGGRYDRSRPLKHNVTLTAPIMSRFDLFFVLVDECNEAVDYAIAKSILKNHRSIAEHVPHKTPYDREMIQKYITFARCFKPKTTEAAKEALVEAYKKLRLSDSCNAATSSWRITVRQLESLVRLSEALAKLHCSATVTVEHVKQATQLLNNSIVRLERAAVALSEDDDLFINEGDKENETEAEPQDKGDAVDVEKLTISYDRYKKISNMLVLHLRHDQERQDDDEDYAGVKEEDLVNWYLEFIQDELDTEEELKLQQTICKRIIRRLVDDDRILIELTQGENPVLVVHPQYEIIDD